MNQKLTPVAASNHELRAEIERLQLQISHARTLLSSASPNHRYHSFTSAEDWRNRRAEWLIENLPKDTP